jgi:hypothetical protein
MTKVKTFTVGLPVNDLHTALLLHVASLHPLNAHVFVKISFTIA